MAIPAYGTESMAFAQQSRRCADIVAKRALCQLSAAEIARLLLTWGPLKAAVEGVGVALGGK